MKRLMIDERTERINGTVSFFVLMLTQIALVGVIVYKRYVSGLPLQEYDELSWIVGLSMASYWALRLYFSGILPVLSVKKALVVYLVIVALIFIPTWLIVGWPTAGRWYEVTYPFIGVGIIMVFYALVAYFGKRRIEKDISKG